ncbi:MAG TPA: 4Fe-4S dicluster domain-containing protein [Anaerovoracaceae bacterium]|nr:4Fe-4S dicluster domain-containing protein [Anaerovoracaceae bacterium]
MPDQKENYFIYADPEKCLGCKSCEIACGLLHSKTDLISAVLEGYRIRPRNRVVQAGGIKTPMQCRQCEDAPCAQVCPSGAISQKDGMVFLNRSVCIGCKSCSMVCPFGAIRIRTEAKDSGDGRIKRAKALKCDLCIEKTGEIDPEACACIRACPTRAISLVDYEELIKRSVEARAKEIAAVVSNRNQKER